MAGAELMTPRQSRALHAMLRPVRGVTGPDRHPVLTEMLGRTVTSARSITRTEAARLLDQLTSEQANQFTEADAF